MTDDERPEVLQGLSDAEATDAFAVVSHELQRKSRARRSIEIGISLLVVIVIFAFVIPRLTGSDYADIWHELGKLSPIEVVALIAFWFLGMLAYTGVLVNRPSP